MVRKIIKTKKIRDAIADKILFDNVSSELEKLYMSEKFKDLHKAIVDYTMKNMSIKKLPKVLSKKPDDNLKSWFVYACDYYAFLSDNFNEINIPLQNGIFRTLDIPPTIRAIYDFLGGFTAGL
jgi:hypothetical protein